MSSIFGRFKGGSTPSSATLGIIPSKKSAAQTPSTPLERWLVETGPLKGDGHDKYFGMHNPSNTCYCNSVVQCLYFSEPFREQVVTFPRLGQKHSAAQHDPSIARAGNGATNGVAPDAQATQKPAATPGTQQENKESFDYQKKVALAAGPHLKLEQGLYQSYGMPESLFTSLKDLFEAIIAHESRTGIVSPARFLEVLKRNHETFRSNVHQDAHEFLNILLNEVVEQVEAYSKNIGKGPDAAAGLGLSLPAQPAQTSQNSKPISSWVHELFEGTLTSETRCLTCENVSQRDEAFLDLSVDLEEHSSVTSCLRKFSEEEMLCERNKFHCDKCSGLQEAEKRMKVKRLPRILALHLKRFKFIEEIGNFRKLFHRVVYPFHLRLLNTTDDAEDPDRLYELYAVVVHLGSTPFHGHYVSIIKTKDRGWLLFDDELVLPVNKEYVRNFFGGDPRNPACAYVLFYQETSIESVQREQETEDDLAEVPVVGNFDSHGIVATDEDAVTASSPALTAETAPTPGVEEGDAFARLEHYVTAPAYTPIPPSSSASHDEPLTALPVVGPSSSAGISFLDTSQQRPPSFDEQRAYTSPTKPQGGGVIGGSMNRLRHTSMNLRSKPKFWSNKDKSPAPPTSAPAAVAQPPPLSVGDAALDEDADDPSAGLIQHEVPAAAPSPVTTPMEAAAKPERAKSARFSLGRKKANVPP